MATGRAATERQVIRVSGDGAREFLHDLVTSDVAGLAAGQARYGALLTPQGKYLADFIMLGEAQAVLIDVAATQAPALSQRLGMYRLRRKLTIEDAGLAVLQIWGEGAEGAAHGAAHGLKQGADQGADQGAGALAVADPRDPALGWRVYGPGAALPPDVTDAPRAAWDALRIAAGAPEPEAELTPDSYILEYGFERLNGIDFRKGCYVGQEIIARMKHKTDLRKGLVRVRLTGEAPAPGTAILTEGGKPAGVLGAAAGGEALAHLRFDRADGPMTAGDAVVTRI